MNKKYTTLTVNQAIDTILDRGAQKLYDKYLQRKLPNHTNQANDDQVHNNFKMLSLKPSKHEKIEVVATKIVRSIPIDNFAAKRITVKRHSQQTSIPEETSIFKLSNFDKSTKYQTIAQTQNTIKSQINNSKDIGNSMLLQESMKKIPMFVKSDRPSTMQVSRTKAKDDSNAFGDIKLQEVEQKRAATCHVRKRKSIINADKQRFIEIKEQPHYFQEEIDSMNKLRKEKQERNVQEVQTDRVQTQEQARFRMKQRKAMQEFEELKKTLRGKHKINPPITNFQNNQGCIVINGRQKPAPQTHIIQLEFNPQQEQTFSTIEPKHSTVSPSKTKSFFCTKLKKKLKLSNEEFTNNGSRQISSIPFVALSYGIVLSQGGLQATASRRRPISQITRQKFNQEQTIKFKSHIPIVNSARLAAFNTVDIDHTLQSSFAQNNPSYVEKNLQATIESKIGMQGSLLWNPRGRSQGKAIRISNRQLLQRQMLFESKLAMAQ